MSEIKEQSNIIDDSILSDYLKESLEKVFKKHSNEYIVTAEQKRFYTNKTRFSHIKKVMKELKRTKIESLKT